MLIRNYRSLVFSNKIPDLCKCKIDFVDFIDVFQKHVVAGDLNIIRNKKLHFMIGLGTKFRLNQKINKNTAIQVFKKD